MRVLTWNLFHGRARPAANKDLLDEFAGLMAGWEWDLAVLQEVPPWWPPVLARACEAQQSTALTSRNALLGLRRALARRRPNLMKSNGGGSNALLSRTGLGEVRTVRLRTWPERRVAQIARVPGGPIVAGYHASTRPARAEQELAALASMLRAEPDASLSLIAGDLNLQAPKAAGFQHVAGHGVDHVLASQSLAPTGEPLIHDSRAGGHELSDHAPLEVELT